ncbi:holo-ACP synthase [Thioalkalivibrio paradoxus]|uniref:Holo-[acyl-carrier-protein] synthase n=1 Tax=Thioalkalivibrio paradoxus ARh 1 TaxID=713585 RepID=W0DK99_9GAMM|nr:holo-ACP synthase [Thioalkalivibrio paradoxus]AHE98876.1 4'-phosphopantetheinyl transferase [Thioalkalivibrio paradoxus ARh 1]
MILGVGTDLVRVERLGAMLQRHRARLLQRVLHPQEQAELPVVRPEAFVARRFAAKEALAKAFGCGIGRDMALHEVWVTHDARGRPEFELTGSAARTAARLGVARIHLSISDEHQYAQAFVVVEGER